MRSSLDVNTLNCSSSNGVSWTSRPCDREKNDSADTVSEEVLVESGFRKDSFSSTGLSVVGSEVAIPRQIQSLMEDYAKHEQVRGILYGGSRLLQQADESSDWDFIITCAPTILDAGSRLELIRANTAGLSDINVFNDTHQGFGTSDDYLFMGRVEVCTSLYSHEQLVNKVKHILSGHYEPTGIFNPLGTLKFLSQAESFVDKDRNLDEIIKLVSEYPAELQRAVIEFSGGKFNYRLDRLTKKVVRELMMQKGESLPEAFTKKTLSLSVDLINQSLQDLLQVLFAKHKCYFTGLKRLESQLEFLPDNETDFFLSKINQIKTAPHDSKSSILHKISSLRQMHKRINSTAPQPARSRAVFSKDKQKKDEVSKFLDHPAFAGQFIGADESGIETLTDQIAGLHNEIVKQVRVGDTRVPFDPDYEYKDVLSEMSLPKIPSEPEEVLKGLADTFKGTIRWQAPEVMLNVTPPPLLAGIAAKTMAGLRNPNALWDYTAGNMLLHEREIVKHLSELAGWDWEETEGMSASGGKATQLYAARIGLNKCGTGDAGIDPNTVLITSTANHYAIESVCFFSGIGAKNCMRVSTNDAEEMDLEDFERTLEECLQAGKKIAGIMLSGGSTLDHNIDPVREICKIRDKLSAKYSLDYKPHVHLDSVNGFPWLTFRYYDFKANPLGISADVLPVIRRVSNKMAEVIHADSFSADFHKTGLAPYSSTFFVAKGKEDVYSLNQYGYQDGPSGHFGERHSHHFTLENSRPADGILTAYASLHSLGVEGFQRYFAYLMTLGLKMRGEINQNHSDQFEVLNGYSNWHATVLMPKFSEFAGIGFEQLMNTDDDQLRVRHNQICNKYARHLDLESQKHGNRYPLLGYIPAYRKEKTSTAVAAMLMYPMSPHYTTEKCREMVGKIVDSKAEFEAALEYQDDYSCLKIPTHLPK